MNGHKVCLLFYTLSYNSLALAHAHHDQEGLIPNLPVNHLHFSELCWVSFFNNADRAPYRLLALNRAGAESESDSNKVSVFGVCRNRLGFEGVLPNSYVFTLRFRLHLTLSATDHRTSDADAAATDASLLTEFLCSCRPPLLHRNNYLPTYHKKIVRFRLIFPLSSSKKAATMTDCISCLDSCLVIYQLSHGIGLTNCPI